MTDAVFSTKTREYSTLVSNLIRDSVVKLRRIFGVTDDGVFRVEIECRYNIYTTEKQYNSVLSRLSKTIKVSPTYTSMDDINYTVDPSPNFRVTIRNQVMDASSGGADIWMIKHTIFPADRQDRAKYYDLVNYFQQRGFKFSVSIEFPKPKDYKPPYGITGFKRSKNRVTFLDGKGKNQIQWDLTKVREQGSDNIKYEIELEKNIELAEFNESVVNAHLIACQTRGISYVYSSPVLPIPILNEYRMYTNNVAVASKDLISALTGRETREDNRVIPTIPGSVVPQVVNFQVQNLLKENYQDYCITPKADGYRFFMVVQDDYIVLLQPPNTFKVFASGQNSPFPPGYIFDGELVFKENMIKDPAGGPPMTDLTAAIDYVYYIFDVVKYPDNRVPGTLMERYLTIERDIFPSGKSIKCGRMLINRKPYLSASSCPWDAVSQYFDEIEKTLYYKTDGLIFTPNNSTYRGLVENKSLKWKPTDMLTMDLRYNNGRLFMFNIDLERETLFEGSKQHPIVKEFNVTIPQNITVIDNMIYEFLYTPESNEMKITRERLDKLTPNNSKVVVDVWNDIHNPISRDILSGNGQWGLVECRKEALWSWLKVICRGTVVDLSDINPSVDIPVRYLDTEFQKLMLGCNFMNISQVNSDISSIDVIIIDGLLYDFLEGNIDDTLPILDAEIFMKMHGLVKKANKIFIRGLPMHKEDIIVDRLSLGQQSEISIWRRDEKTVHIDSINLSIFRNFTNNTYNVPRVTSRIRSFPNNCIVVPAGNRVGSNLDDISPDSILSGKLCGIWDYVVNALIPSEVLRDNTSRITMGEAELTDIIPQYIPEEIEPLEQLSSDMDRVKIVPEEILKTDTSAPLPSITLETKSKGDVFKCIAYAFFQMTKELNREIPIENIEGHASELRLLYGNMTGSELSDAILHSFKLGIVWVYMIEGDILGAQFPPLVNEKPPKNGYILISPSLMFNKELNDEMTLITTGETNSPVTPSYSPLIANLMRRTIRARYMTRASKDLTKTLSSKKIIGSENITSCGLEIHYESLPFRSRLSKLGKVSFTEEDILDVVDKSDIAKLIKTENELLYDVNVSNTQDNLLGYTLMKIRWWKLTKQK